jgi:hypothetical protein
VLRGCEAAKIRCATTIYRRLKAADPSRIDAPQIMAFHAGRTWLAIPHNPQVEVISHHAVQPSLQSLIKAAKNADLAHLLSRRRVAQSSPKRATSRAADHGRTHRSGIVESKNGSTQILRSAM